jgi:hypothetical protein
VPRLWTLEQAAAWLLTSKERVVDLLGKNKDKVGPPLYRSHGRRRWRYVRDEDIAALWRVMYSETRYHRKWSPLVGDQDGVPGGVRP